MVGKSIFSFSYIFSRSLLFVLLHVGSKKKAGRGAGYSSASSGIFFLWATSSPPRLSSTPSRSLLSVPVPLHLPPCAHGGALKAQEAALPPAKSNHPSFIGGYKTWDWQYRTFFFLGKICRPPSSSSSSAAVVSSRELALETREEEEEEGTEMAISAPCRSQSPLPVLPSLWLPSISRGSASSASSIFHFPTEREEEEKG